MIGIGLHIGNRVMGGGIDAQAQAHYDRVIADGGVVPSGLSGVNAFYNAVKTIYGTTDITTAVSVGLDAQYLGYKLGAGAGATSGQAAQKLYSCAGSSGDVVQTTAASQPLLLAHSGSSSDNYWYSPQVTGNFCQTNNISINTNSGMSVEAKVSFTTDEDTSNSGGWICSNDDGGLNRNMFLGFSGTRTLIIYWSNLSRSATATAQIPAAYSGWIKTTLETSDSDMLVKFWTSPDGSAWTQLGATITNVGGANTFQTNNAQFYVTGNGGANTIKGKIYRLIYKNAIGTIRADFNPATYNASTSQTQWTSTTGEVWTINTGTASSGYKGVLVDRTIVQGDGVTAYMQQNGSLGFNINSANSFYLATKKFNTTSQFPFEYRRGSGGNGILVRIAAVYSNYREGQSYQATSFSNNLNLNLFNSVFQTSVNRSANLNNGTIQSDSTAGTIASDAVDNIGFFGFGSNSGANYNGNINSFIITKSADTTPQQTAMYNYIKSINNSAF